MDRKVRGGCHKTNIFEPQKDMVKEYDVCLELEDFILSKREGFIHTSELVFFYQVFPEAKAFLQGRLSDFLAKHTRFVYDRSRNEIYLNHSFNGIAIAFTYFLLKQRRYSWLFEKLKLFYKDVPEGKDFIRGQEVCFFSHFLQYFTFILCPQGKYLGVCLKLEPIEAVQSMETKISRGKNISKLNEESVCKLIEHFIKNFHPSESFISTGSISIFYEKYPTAKDVIRENGGLALFLAGFPDRLKFDRFRNRICIVNKHKHTVQNKPQKSQSQNQHHAHRTSTLQESLTVIKNNIRILKAEHKEPISRPKHQESPERTPRLGNSSSNSNSLILPAVEALRIFLVSNSSLNGRIDINHLEERFYSKQAGYVRSLLKGKERQVLQSSFLNWFRLEKDYIILKQPGVSDEQFVKYLGEYILSHFGSISFEIFFQDFLRARSFSNRFAFTSDDMAIRYLQSNLNDYFHIDSENKRIQNIKIVLNRKLFLEQSESTSSVIVNPSSNLDGYITDFPVIFTIANLSHLPLVFRTAYLYYPTTKEARSCEMEFKQKPNLITIPSFQQIKLTVDWKPNCPTTGFRLHVAHVVFVFDDQTVVSRFIETDAGKSEFIGIDELKPKKEYVPSTPLILPHIEDFPKPKSFSNSDSVYLPKFHPKNVPLFETPSLAVFKELEVKKANYITWFRTALYLLEAHERKELENYDLRDVYPSKIDLPSSILWFKVPGLAEKRPSVLVNDRVILQSINTVFKKELDVVGGTVTDVTESEIAVVFHPYQFPFNSSFNIRFVASRYPYLLFHEALSRLNSSGFLGLHEEDMHRNNEFSLFPQTLLLGFQCYSRLNEKQKLVVRTILAMHSKTRISPFILFGPPGTGKTTTMISAILCLLKTHRTRQRILVACSSNTACDEFDRALKRECSRDPIFVDLSCNIERFYAESQLGRERKNPTLAELEKAKVIIATCSSSMKLCQLTSKFSHIMIDEAAQATEPEALCAITPNYQPGCQVILAGDHKQLGPIVRSQVLTSLSKIDCSLMERLMRFQVYKEDPFLSIQLEENYRACQSLIEISSRLFYSSSLKSKLQESSNSFLKLRRSFLPNPSFPIILHHVNGAERREETSPSWFNLSECEKVLSYLKVLTSTSCSPPLDFEKDVMIICPYIGQVHRVRKLMQLNRLKSRVGTIESFQGSEARVVIVTTCRSSSRTDDYDAAHHVGFLKNPKRFNVAITRAKELLIVIGNSYVLSEDPHWKHLLEYCKQNRGFIRD